MSDNGCCGAEVTAVVPGFTHVGDARCQRHCVPGTVERHSLNVQAVSLPANGSFDVRKDVAATCSNSTMRVEINLRVAIDLLGS